MPTDWKVWPWRSVEKMELGILWNCGIAESVIAGLSHALSTHGNVNEDRWLDDGTSDIDILDAFDYGIERWCKPLIKI